MGFILVTRHPMDQVIKPSKPHADTYRLDIDGLCANSGRYNPP